MSSEDNSCVLFVKNISYDTTNESLKEHFPDCVDVRIPRKPEGGIKGFAFVQFDREEDVEDAVENLQGSELDGRPLYLDYMGDKSRGGGGSRGGRGRRDDRGGRSDRYGRDDREDRRGGGGGGSYGEAGKTRVLFVANLSYRLTEDTLREAFDGATSARIATYPDSGRSKGFGFVEFDTPEAAQNAFETMNQQEVEGREVRLDYASERQQQMGGGGGGDRRGGARGRGGFRGGYRGGR